MNQRGVAIRPVRLLAVVAGVLALTGCGTWYAGLRESPENASADYADALEAHSMRAWSSIGFDQQVSVAATIQTEAFVAARRAEQARLLSLPPGQVFAPESSLLDGESGVAVVIFIEALRPGWERLDRSETDWRFFLVVDGVRYEPDVVRGLDGRDTTLVHLFPYMTRFGRPWLLVFPVDDPGNRPALIMTGAPAQLRLEFDLR